MLSTIKFTPVEANNWYYGKYRYCVKFNVRELSVIRGLEPDKIDAAVHHRNLWRTQNRYGYRQEAISHETTVSLKTICCKLHELKDQIKFVVSYDTGYVYANDQQIVQDIASIDFIKSVKAKEIVQIAPQGTIRLKNSDWAYRTYFRGKTLTEAQRNSLVEFLNSRENVRLSPALTRWVGTPSPYYYHSNLWLQNHYFMDHNDSKDLLFLNMIVPKITGRTFSIVAK